jgi:hypothetical protein
LEPLGQFPAVGGKPFQELLDRQPRLAPPSMGKLGTNEVHDNDRLARQLRVSFKILFYAGRFIRFQTMLELGVDQFGQEGRAIVRLLGDEGVDYRMASCAESFFETGEDLLPPYGALTEGPGLTDPIVERL